MELNIMNILLVIKYSSVCSKFFLSSQVYLPTFCMVFPPIMRQVCFISSYLLNLDSWGFWKHHDGQISFYSVSFHMQRYYHGSYITEWWNNVSSQQTWELSFGFHSHQTSSKMWFHSQPIFLCVLKNWVSFTDHEGLGRTPYGTSAQISNDIALC